MAADCGLPHDHDQHYDMIEGVLIKCDGDADKRPNYDNSIANKTGIN